MKNTLNYTNKAGESVFIETSKVESSLPHYFGNANIMIDKVTINGIFLTGCVYVHANSEAEIKSIVSRIRKNKISRIK